MRTVSNVTQDSCFKSNKKKISHFNYNSLSQNFYNNNSYDIHNASVIL